MGEEMAREAPGAVNEIEDRFRRLVAIMARLRAPDGCPWDREQTHKSLTPYLIEEAYEVKDSLDNEDFEELREELGDLTLQVVFHAQLAREAARFDIDDVLEAICQKLIRRHPHVFGEVEVDGSGEVLRNWEQIKQREREQKAGNDDPPPSILRGVPPSLPALLKAHRIQQKVAHVGFDWDDDEPVWDKIHEEIEELREALEGQPRERVAEELGDLLFSIVNLARRLEVTAEEALDATNRKFMARFRHMERQAHLRNQNLANLSLEQLDALWNQSKSTH